MGQLQLEIIRARAAALTSRLRVLQYSRPITVSFMPSAETDSLRYFSAERDAEFQSAIADGFRYLLPQEGGAEADIVVLTVHGSDLSSTLWDLRLRVSDHTLIAVWLWDNHVAEINNFRTVLAADFVFPSHGFASAYLFNPLSAVASHIPLCTAQWTGDEARKILLENTAIPRQHKALVNYVDYPFTARGTLFRALQAQVPHAEVLLMPPEDRSRYFNKTPEQRLVEWLGYKATIILPLQCDLSTRLFDALLAGQVPVVPDSVLDLDKVISPQEQAELGIVRVREENIETLKPAVDTALETYDRMGAEGVSRRQEFVLTRHMLPHRLNAMLGSISDMAQRAEIRVETHQPGFGLYATPMAGKE